VSCAGCQHTTHQIELPTYLLPGNDIGPGSRSIRTSSRTCSTTSSGRLTSLCTDKCAGIQR
jgi:hypothetical protein